MVFYLLKSTDLLLLTKPLLLVVFIGLFYSIKIQYVNAQSLNNEPSNFWNNVSYGISGGGSFSSGNADATLSPVGVYRFNPYASVGSSLNFAYAKRKNSYESYVIGISLLGIFNPIPEIQLSVEPQQSFVSRNFDSRTEFTDENYWVSSLFLGVGFNAGNVTVGIQYDVLHDPGRSVFIDAWHPFLRVFF